MFFGPFPLSTVAGSFLLALPALFSIVNPIGSSLIFVHMTASATPAERVRLSRQIALNAMAILLGSIWLGSYALNFFGVSLGALRLGGGLVVAVAAWKLLMADDPAPPAQSPSPEDSERLSRMAFFPLTMPITTGPGSIAVAIALASERPTNGDGAFAFFGGLTLAAATISAMVFVFYALADRILRFLDPAAVRVIGRLVAFLLLCIGVQIMTTGAETLLSPWLIRTARAVR